MKLPPHSLSSFLAAGQTTTAYARPGTRLHVRSGRLWLTQSGDPHDHFLVAGDRFTVGAGRVVLQADTPADVRYAWEHTPSALQRLRMAARRYITWRAMSLTMSR